MLKILTKSAFGPNFAVRIGKCKKIGKKATHKGVNAVARNHLPKEGGTVRKSIYKDSQDQGTVKNMSKSHWEYNTTLSRHIF